ncbi:MAG: acetyl-CoA carboxylase biotin carboxylase subunit, partial [Thiohalomonadales bacterium]
YSGYNIPPYYDSMCAKLIVWALDWDQLLQRAARALNDIRVYGVKTTIPYQLEILKCKDFRSGNFNTSFVQDHPELVNYSPKRYSEHIASAIAAAVAAHMGN